MLFFGSVVALYNAHIIQHEFSMEKEKIEIEGSFSEELSANKGYCTIIGAWRSYRAYFLLPAIVASD